MIDIEGCMLLMWVIKFFCRFDFVVRFLFDNDVNIVVKDKFGCLVLYYLVGFKGNCKIF